MHNWNPLVVTYNDGGAKVYEVPPFKRQLQKARIVVTIRDQNYTLDRGSHPIGCPALDDRDFGP